MITFTKIRGNKFWLFLIAGLALALTAFISLNGIKTAYAAPVVSINQCNNMDNTPGLNVDCTVTVNNVLDTTTGIGSSSTTLKVCEGAAGQQPTCVTTTDPSTSVVNSVTQCNGSDGGGGGTLTCQVNVVNDIVGTATVVAATVNQCVGSGTGGGADPTFVCDPTETTTNADVIQCNGSGNGGGATMRVNCNVTTSTESDVLPVSVNQCVGSANGGGSLVTCGVSILNNVTPASSVTPSPSASASTPPSSGVGSGGTGSGATGGTTGTGGSGTGTNGGTGAGTPTQPNLAHTGVEIIPGLVSGSVILIVGLLLTVSKYRKVKPFNELVK